MIVLMYDKRFAAPILAGVKRHTIRRNRKRPIPIGADLSHRIWSGVAYRSKQETIMDGVCVSVLPIIVAENMIRIDGGEMLLLKAEDQNAFAVSDGFVNWSDMMTYYHDRKIKLPFTGEYIEWRPNVITDLPMITPAVSCENCGACCMHMGYPPFIGMYNYDARNGDTEWLALPRDLAMAARQGAVDGRGDAELPCLWLDPVTKRCSHYDLRPSVCRDFEMGSEDCMSHRQRRGIE